MFEPNIPTIAIPMTANRPDYTPLRQASFDAGPGESADNVLDSALPDNPANPTLRTLKNFVRQFMLTRDAYGHMMAPNMWQAMSGVSQALDANPQLANAELVKSLTHTATHDGETGEPFPSGREAAQRVLGEIAEKRPDLADANLVKNITQIATNDPDSLTRCEAQKTLAKIANNRPDLIDADTLKAVSQTAASPIANYGAGNNLWVHAGKLAGIQNDKADNEAGQTAQQTLKTISEKRPDLTAVQKPAAERKHTGVLIHAAPVSPRISMAP